MGYGYLLTIKWIKANKLFLEISLFSDTLTFPVDQTCPLPPQLSPYATYATAVAAVQLTNLFYPILKPNI